MQAPDPIKIGYVRVSTAEQNTDRQLDGLQLTVTFTDKASGKNADRPQLQAMMAGNWPEGSTVYVHSMDRLARSLSDLLQIVEQLTQRGVNVHFVKEAKIFRGGETSDPMDKLMLSMLGAVAEYERTLIRERQREGIAKAKLRGVYRGRPRKNTDNQRIALIVAEATALGANKTRIAAKHGISRDTLYKYLQGQKLTTCEISTKFP
ncbi:recombinase family protein [Limnohabitans sp.]|uniref:recombinase family protein n=1 Tax=Limnohabitans sp. TaxID=1907725 RepID=UPI0031FDAE01